MTEYTQNWNEIKSTLNAALDFMDQHGAPHVKLRSTSLRERLNANVTMVEMDFHEARALGVREMEFEGVDAVAQIRLEILEMAQSMLSGM